MSLLDFFQHGQKFRRQDNDMNLKMLCYLEIKYKKGKNNENKKILPLTNYVGLVKTRQVPCKTEKDHGESTVIGTTKK